MTLIYLSRAVIVATTGAGAISAPLSLVSIFRPPFDSG